MNFFTRNLSWCLYILYLKWVFFIIPRSIISNTSSMHFDGFCSCNLRISSESFQFKTVYPLFYNCVLGIFYVCSCSLNCFRFQTSFYQSEIKLKRVSLCQNRAPNQFVNFTELRDISRIFKTFISGSISSNPILFQINLLFYFQMLFINVLLQLVCSSLRTERLNETH